MTNGFNRFYCLKDVVHATYDQVDAEVRPRAQAQVRDQISLFGSPRLMTKPLLAALISQVSKQANNG